MTGTAGAATPLTPARTKPGIPAGADLLQALPAAVYTTDAAGRITFYNDAAVALWGVRPELGEAEFCGSWKLYWPDGTPMRHDECPMALALKEKRAIRGMEAIAERPDGSRVSFIPYPTPLFDASGELVGGVNMLIDITGRDRDDQSRKTAEQSARRLAAIVESSEDAILAKDLDGIITDWNQGAERLFGYTAEEAIGRPVTMLIPLERQDEEPAILARIRRGERIEHYETIRRRKDGSLIEISLTVSPVKDGNGRVAGASKIARDITERRRAEERQAMLLREMSHRVKNLFALSGAVITLSTRSAKSPEDLAEQVRNRLGSLARAHELTLPDLKHEQAVTPTTLQALLRTVVSPYEERGRNRVTTVGPDLTITGHAVTSLALLLHELATNAAKYGALSTPAGSLAVEWAIEDGTLSLTWTERGGPPAGEGADAEGFGTWLVDSTIKRQLQGRISRHWEADGLTIQMSMPLDRLMG